VKNHEKSQQILKSAAPPIVKVWGVGSCSYLTDSGKFLT